MQVFPAFNYYDGLLIIFFQLDVMAVSRHKTTEVFPIKKLFGYLQGFKKGCFICIGIGAIGINYHAF